MSDDGTGNDIYIPSALISMKDGNIIYNYLKDHPFKKVTTEVIFENFEESESEDIDVEFFFSSHEPKAYILIKNLSEVIYDFDEKINFIPRYVTHQSPYYKKDNPQKIDNCFSKGKYCYFPKWSGNIATSQNILMENLRQKCIYNLYVEDDISYYYDYMENFYNDCILDRSFNQGCSEKVLKKCGIKKKEIEKCILESFDQEKNEKINFENDNEIFEDDYNTQITYGLTSFPAITINTVPLEGIIKEEKLIIALCDRSNEKPELCDYFYENYKDEGISFGYWIFIIFLILVFISIVIGLFYFCRNYINSRVHQRVYSEGIDLDGRINNAIANYFTLKESGKI